MSQNLYVDLLIAVDCPRYWIFQDLQTIQRSRTLF